MSVERLIEAAKVAVSAIRKLDAFDDFVIERSNLELAISDAELQAADDAEPIERSWCYQTYGESHISINDEFVVLVRNDDSLILWACEGGALPKSYTLELPHIRTRGQLRGLVAALKGGE